MQTRRLDAALAASCSGTTPAQFGVETTLPIVAPRSTSQHSRCILTNALLMSVSVLEACSVIAERNNSLGAFGAIFSFERTTPLERVPRPCQRLRSHRQHEVRYILTPCRPNYSNYTYYMTHRWPLRRSLAHRVAVARSHRHADSSLLIALPLFSSSARRDLHAPVLTCKGDTQRRR